MYYTNEADVTKLTEFNDIKQELIKRNVVSAFEITEFMALKDKNVTLILDDIIENRTKEFTITIEDIPVNVVSKVYYTKKGYISDIKVKDLNSVIRRKNTKKVSIV